MQEKQKVTLYLPEKLHRQIKIRAAVDADSMSNIVERAIDFYLHHPEVVDEVEASHGRAHQVYTCPKCYDLAVLKDGEMVALGNQPLVIEELPVEKVREKVNSRTEAQGKTKLSTLLIG